MMWFWLNIPLAVAFFGAWCGIPLVMVLRNADWGSAKAGAGRVAGQQAAVVYAGEPQQQEQVRELVLAGAQS